MSAINLSKIPTGLLWHYTDFNGFNGIRKGKMWASDIDYLNDSAEFNHLIDVARMVFEAVPTPYKQWKDKEYAKGLDVTLRHWIRQYTHDIYVSSFSKNPDDLSQWRGYARTPPGFCLGFERSLLSDSAISAGFQLIDCEYNLDKQREAVTAAVERQYTAIRMEPGFDENAIPDSMRFYNHRFDKIVRDLIFECIRCKSPAFEAEEECRAISSDQSRPTKFTDIDYRQSGSLLVPFVKWDLVPTAGGPSPLRFVLVGPGPHADEVLAVVKRMCPDVEVNKSAVPFRNW
jgi:hypothetical protein